VIKKNKNYICYSSCVFSVIGIDVPCLDGVYKWFNVAAQMLDCTCNIKTRTQYRDCN